MWRVMRHRIEEQKLWTFEQLKSNKQEEERISLSTVSVLRSQTLTECAAKRKGDVTQR